MTAQAHDRVRWRGQEYSLVGVEGTGLFDPVEHGLETRPTTTANWRGWVATYSLDGEKLVLSRLDDVGLVLEPGRAGSPINGAMPQQSGPGSFEYANVDMHIPFTGRMLIARGFIQGLYVHMGFHPAWKFEESWEFELQDGAVTASRDLSKQMRKVRKDIKKGKSQNPDDPGRPGWIERTFRLDVGRSRLESPPESFRVNCAECGRDAGGVELTPPFSGSADPQDPGFDRWRLHVEGPVPATHWVLRDVERIRNAIAFKSVKDLAEIDPEYVNFWCRECEAVYCPDHWRPIEPMMDEGFYDMTFGTCPRGHRVVLDD